MKSINPALNEFVQDHKEISSEEVYQIIEDVQKEWKQWKNKTIEGRANLLREVAVQLRADKEKLAKIISIEMGKVLSESYAEVEKSAWVCEYYADNTKSMLKDEFVETDAFKSFVSFEPLGIILGVMPWNFPFWQVFRFAAPALMAGNATLLKHASNVQGCAKWICNTFHTAGLPRNIFRNLSISSAKVEEVIKHPHIKAISLTGSEAAGKSVAALAGKYLKKTVLELGGSDPFIVLKDADIKAAAATAVKARFMNNGQSCIAAKRFIVEKDVLDEFVQEVYAIVKTLKTGCPLDEGIDLGPLAREDLRQEIDRQVKDSIKMGAKLICGGKNIDREGFFYEATILTAVTKGMPVADEESFGPVMPILEAKDAEEAILLANDSSFGLGASLWTQNMKKAETLARTIESGAVFINEMTKSDPRMPFGGIKNSGYGRELSHYGPKEFVNIKSIWIA